MFWNPPRLFTRNFFKSELGNLAYQLSARWPKSVTRLPIGPNPRNANIIYAND